jgi:hypothetical protein
MQSLAMGFFHGSARPPWGDVGPIITSREYIRLLAGATRSVISCTPQDSDICRSGAPGAVALSSVIQGLSRRLHHRPEDATAHRMLGIAELQAGNRRAAVRHLAIAVNLLLAPTTDGCLQRSLHARVELALLLPTLITLCLRLGRRTTARRLVTTLLSRVAGS